MKRLRFVVSLTTTENDYQMEQSKAAEEAGRKLGVDVQLIYADNDTITQSQQLLNIIQSRSDSHPDGILFEPVGGTALPQVGKAAVAAGIAWVVLNREIDYIADLRRANRVPVFSVAANHEEVGRIQAKQVAALLPKGGSILYIEGPAENYAAKQRTVGFYEGKPQGIQVKSIRGNWTEASAHKAITSWLRLSTSRQTKIDAIIAQNDAMAVGARKAFQEISDVRDRDRWLNLPYTGVDGVPKTGQAWVKSGLLAATVVVAPNTDVGIEMLVRAVQTGAQPPERNLMSPRSVPAIEDLARSHGEKVRALSV
ncbi:MAG TPA: sugar ABC transporter substrate-binding protein [Terriglobales bacterium]|jgi:ABC-type sugar transport system substrate-binding protein